jgi:rhodanese-related sulfurtransferase
LKFIVDNWILILMALTSGALLLVPVLRRSGVGSGGNSVGTAEAVRLINREKGVLIDVSDAAEFAAGHASGARNVPLAQLGDNASAIKGLPSNKTVPVLLLCPTGGRAARAAALLRKAGYEKALAIAGGTAAWREAQLPIEKSAESKAEAKAA